MAHILNNKYFGVETTNNTVKENKNNLIQTLISIS